MARQLEAKYKNDYLAMKYPTKLQMKNVRLGPIPQVKFSRMYKVTQRRADAIVKDGDTIVIIETKLRKINEAIGQLLAYRQLFRETPELSEWKSYGVRCELVTPIEDVAAKRSAASEGIDYVRYQPAWVLTELAKK